MNKIYYFTRTNDSKRIAEQIAKQTNGVVLEIKDSNSYKGIIGFIKAGYMASSKKLVPAIYDLPELADTIYLCFPVWASNLPPVVASFIKDIGRQRIIAVPTSLGSSLKDV